MFGYSPFSSVPFSSLPPLGDGITAIASITLDDVTVSGTATVDIQASASITLDDVITNATATVDLTASASITLDDVTLSATANVLVQASADITLDDVVGSGELSITDPILAESSVQLDDVTVSGVVVLEYFPMKPARTLGQQITKAQATLPAHITKQISSATQITA